MVTKRNGSDKKKIIIILVSLNISLIITKVFVNVYLWIFLYIKKDQVVLQCT